ncbi:PilZ domain-containing protein [Sphingomonas parva]|nr:PilZ domain-containing protein [Sphingomonas parva]
MKVTAAAGGNTEDLRQEAGRAGLLLAASIEARGLSAPVRIRNLSESGAAIEGDSLPPPGAAIILRRLDLAVPGLVAWSSGQRCGVHFDVPTRVSAWVMGSRTPPQELDRQTRVDALQAEVRSGAAAAPLPPTPTGPPRPGLDTRLADELGYVRSLLEKLGDELTGEPDILARHATALQSFDLVDQILGHVANVLVAADRPLAIGAIGMEELRLRLLGQASS